MDNKSRRRKVAPQKKSFIEPRMDKEEYITNFGGWGTVVAAAGSYAIAGITAGFVAGPTGVVVGATIGAAVGAVVALASHFSFW